MKQAQAYFTVAALWHKQSATLMTGSSETEASIELVKPTTILAVDQADADLQLARMIPNEGAAAGALQDSRNIQRMVRRTF